MRFLFVLAMVFLTACSSTPPAPVVGNVDNLYNRGMDLLSAQKYQKAIHTFEELERQHPYSGWATRAQMMVAYAQYRLQLHDESIATINAFINLHPGHKDLAYMYYLKAMNDYIRISDVNRDQGHTEEARQSFEVIVQRFPQSVYARDAKLKLTLTLDHIAGKEMAVGRFYQSKGKYLAALNRFKRVVDAYETSLQTPEALYRLTETYFALGLDAQATRTAAVLGHNYPETEWYHHAYYLLTEKGYLEGLEEKEKGTWWQRLKSAFN